ncbi:hypothetical protein BDN72DRAFT_505012 [Pluteus cervinus]|uniref:Uncharacterized protein n=1 Tax=Pluteus cervinus TaxID=181527 RepID=A0ACD3AZN5_9AGAR|nr:hypothetical protein BDN72DRAFT_505012 [Pluteus cervinus]
MSLVVTALAASSSIAQHRISLCCVPLLTYFPYAIRRTLNHVSVFESHKQYIYTPSTSTFANHTKSRVESFVSFHIIIRRLSTPPPARLPLSAFQLNLSLFHHTVGQGIRS